jgi:hypothetical protein
VQHAYDAASGNLTITLPDSSKLDHDVHVQFRRPARPLVPARPDVKLCAQPLLQALGLTLVAYLLHELSQGAAALTGD